jgi:hypothetical protein
VNDVPRGTKLRRPRVGNFGPKRKVDLVRLRTMLAARRDLSQFIKEARERLDALLAERSALTTPAIAQRLGVSTRSVVRAIKFINDERLKRPEGP